MSPVLAEALPAEKPDGSSLKGAIRLDRYGEQVHLEGSLSVDLNHDCDRCLGEMTYPLSIDLKMDLTPLEELEQATVSGQELELTEKDLEFSFYAADEFDLSEIIRDQLVLSLPPHFICSEDCRGLCPQCGANLNLKPCQCSESVNPSSPWAVLKDLKVSTKLH